MMNRALLFLLALVILFWWLAWPNNKAVAPNVISQQRIQAEPEVIDEDITPEVKVNESVDKSFITVTQNTQVQVDKSINYMTYYRDFRLLKTCPMICDPNQNIAQCDVAKRDRMAEFKAIGVQAGAPISTNHLSHYEFQIDRCIQMAEKYAGKFTVSNYAQTKSSNQSLYEHLQERLLNASTETEKEAQLKQLRNIKEPWDKAWMHLFNVAKGIISSEALAIKTQLDELNAQWRQQFKGVEFEFTDTERNTHFEKRKELEAQLSQLISEDPKVKQQAWQHVNDLTDEIKSYMYLQDADLFFEASALLADERKIEFINGRIRQDYFMNENIQKIDIPYLLVGVEVMQLTQEVGRLIFLATAPYANQLYLCTTGEDCAPGSTFMNHYCLKPEHPTACEKDLMTFLADDYLSPNQLQDVLDLYEQLVIIYAP